VAQDVHPAGEEALALLRVQAVNEVRAVVLAGLLVAQDQTARDALGHLGGHVVDILLQVLDGELLLVDVGGISTAGQTGQGGQVATVATHRLDDEHSALGALGRLTNTVADLRDLIQTSVTAQGEFCTGHIVRDRRWDNHDRDAELRVVVPLIGNLSGGMVTLEATDDQKTLDLELLQTSGDLLELALGQSTLSAQVGTTLTNPSRDIGPEEGV